jgi:hypothetical protein
MDTKIKNFNPKSLPRDQLCAIAYSFRQSRIPIILASLETLLSTLTLYVIWRLLKCKQMQRAWGIIGEDLKLVAAVGIGYYVLGTVSSAMVGGYKTVSFNLMYRY